MGTVNISYYKYGIGGKGGGILTLRIAERFHEDEHTCSDSHADGRTDRKTPVGTSQQT